MSGAGNGGLFSLRDVLVALLVVLLVFVRYEHWAILQIAYRRVVFQGLYDVLVRMLCIDNALDTWNSMVQVLAVEVWGHFRIFAGLSQNKA